MATYFDLNNKKLLVYKYYFTFVYQTFKTKNVAIDESYCNDLQEYGTDMFVVLESYIVCNDGDDIRQVVPRVDL